MTDFAALNGRRISWFDPERFATVRDSLIGRGYRWPAWCYLATPLVGATLGEEVAIDANPSLLSPATVVAHLIASWTP